MKLDLGANLILPLFYATSFSLFSLPAFSELWQFWRPNFPRSFGDFLKKWSKKGHQIGPKVQIDLLLHCQSQNLIFLRDLQQKNCQNIYICIGLVSNICTNYLALVFWVIVLLKLELFSISASTLTLKLMGWWRPMRKLDNSCLHLEKRGKLKTCSCNQEPIN